MSWPTASSMKLSPSSWIPLVFPSFELCNCWLILSDTQTSVYIQQCGFVSISLSFHRPIPPPALPPAAYLSSQPEHCHSCGAYSFNLQGALWGEPSSGQWSHGGKWLHVSSSYGVIVILFESPFPTYSGNYTTTNICWGQNIGNISQKKLPKPWLWKEYLLRYSCGFSTTTLYKCCCRLYSSKNVESSGCHGDCYYLCFMLEKKIFL